MAEAKTQSKRGADGPNPGAPNGQANGDSGGQKYDPDAPIGSVGNLKQILEQFQERIAEVMPKHLTPERMLKLTLIAVNKQPTLLECSGGTIMQSVLQCSELGLDISGTLGEAYLVPFFNKKANRYECQLIIGYRGLIKLARQSGEVVRVEAEVVCENDYFVFQKGSEIKVEWRPCLTDDPGKRLGAYALVQFPDGTVQADWMPASRIEKVKKFSKASSGPWQGDFDDEMWKKTVWRRLSKWSPLSSEKYNRALEVSDDEFDWEVTERRTENEKAAALAGRLLDAKREPDITPGSFTTQGREPEKVEVLQDRAAPAKQQAKPLDQVVRKPLEEQADVGDTISKMIVEVEQCAEFQKQTDAERALKGIQARYSKIASSWPPKDQARITNAFSEAFKVVEGAFPSEPAATEEEPEPEAEPEAEDSGGGDPPWTSDREMTAEERFLAEGDKPEGWDDEQPDEPAAKKKAGSDLFGASPLFK